MSFSREIKDFVGAFQVGAKLWKDSEYSAARAKYFSARTEKLANPDPLDQKVRELRVRDLEARIRNTDARTAAVGRRGAGAGGGGGGGLSGEALRGFLSEGEDEGEGEDGGDEFDAAPAQTSALDLDPQPTTFAASGGMIDPADQSHGEYWQGEHARAQSAGEPTPAQPLASLGEAIGSGLKFLQRSFGLDQDSAALPGTDPQRQQRVEAMMRGAGAPSDDEMRMVRKTVDPSGEVNDGVANATAVERAYDFHKGRGDTAAAEKVSAQFLQYYRGQAAKLGALAQEALNNGNMDGAINAAVAGFNQMPNGSVAKRAGDKVIITDYKSGQPVEEIPLTPSLVAEAAKGLMDGSTFFTFMAQAAGKGVATGGTPPIDGASETAAAAPTPTPTPTPQPRSQDASPPASALPEDLAAPDANEVQAPGAPGGMRAPKPPRLIPLDRALAAGASRQQLTQFDKINKQRLAVHRQRVSEFNTERRRLDDHDRLDRRTVSEIQSREAIDERQRRSQQTQIAQQQHMERMRNDPAYRREVELAEINRTGAAATQRIGALDDLGAELALAGDVMRPEKGRERESNQRTLNMVPGKKLNATARNAEKGMEYGRDDELVPALDAVFARGTPDASGKFDTKKLPTTDPEVRLRMVDFMESITRTNKLSAPQAARIAFDAIYSVDPNGPGPRAVRDENGYRIQIGNRRLFIDNDAFRDLAEARGMRMNELREAAKKITDAEDKKRGDAIARRNDRDRQDEMGANRRPNTNRDLLQLQRRLLDQRFPAPARGALPLE